MLKIHRFIVNNFGENTYLAVDAETGNAAVIDPGMLHGNERSAFDKFIAENGIRLEQIILTHAHLDHCFGADYVRNRYNVPVKAHEGDAVIARSLPAQSRRFGMGDLIRQPLEFDVRLSDGDMIEIGNSRLKVIAVPGHSPGGIVLYDETDKLAFVGDSIFEGSIGRTDLEGGDFTTLINALKERVLTLPEDTVLLPGHGEPTTVGSERKHNPFLK